MKRLALVALVVVALVTAFTVTRAVIKTKKIRERPDRSSVLRMVNAWGPAGTLHLYLLLRPGDELYQAAILPWIYGDQISLADTPWNRRILETSLLSTPKALALEHAPSYPLTPGPRLHPLLVEALNGGAYGALRVLDRSGKGRSGVNEWVQERLVARQDADLFGSVLPVLLQLEAIDLPALLTELMPLLAEKTDVLPVDSKQLGEALSKSPTAPGLLAWVTDAISRRTITFAFAKPLLTALLITPATSEATGEFLLGRSGISGPDLFSLIDPDGCLEDPEHDCSLLDGLPSAVLVKAFEVAEQEPPKFLALFHALLHAEDDRSVQAASRILQRSDSETRKGVIVLLRRHEQQQPSYAIDDAFKGDAPRTLLFSDSGQYTTSTAGRAYQQLSGHAYDKIGKRFPPYLGGRIPTLSDAEGWRDFISTYPWFPAADDALYRLAHVYFMNGQLDQAAETLAAFDASRFVDSDAEPYIALLAQVVQAARAPAAPEHAIAIARATGDLEWISWVGGPQVHRLENAVLAVDWLMANQAPAEVLGLQRSFLERVRLALDSSREKCRESWFETCDLPDDVELLLLRAHESGEYLSYRPPQIEFTLALLEALLGRPE